ncbi:MAG: DUF3006 family protein [Candidatus Aegiribacteria sp.]|nr:DUF3006 family protein [Candidatus Aegiribacteria sp.]MBD3295489.1 DUF3006 family protein [Candidatus Fermentibacteria bacterium]
MLVSLDRIEEGTAVLLTRDGHMWLLPSDCLPAGSREGDVFDVILEKNEEETEALAGRIRSLQHQLLERTRQRNEGSDDGS